MQGPDGFWYRQMNYDSLSSIKLTAHFCHLIALQHQKVPAFLCAAIGRASTHLRECFVRKAKDKEDW